MLEGDKSKGEKYGKKIDLMNPQHPSFVSYNV